MKWAYPTLRLYACAEYFYRFLKSHPGPKPTNYLTPSSLRKFADTCFRPAHEKSEAWDQILKIAAEYPESPEEVISVNLKMNPFSKLKQLIPIRKNKWKFVYLTRDRHYAFIDYPSDPTLAEGGKLIMEAGKRKVLQTLVRHVENSLVDIGLSGEVVAESSLSMPWIE